VAAVLLLLQEAAFADSCASEFDWGVRGALFPDIVVCWRLGGVFRVLQLRF